MKDNDAVIKRAKERRKLSYEADRHNRVEMLDDLRFSALDQWPEDVKRERKGRPMLTLDKTGQAVKRIIGDIQENRPAIKVNPVDGGADKDTAEVFEGLIRQIEEQSNAVDAYINAARSQVKCGYGVWRITSEYATHDAFEQDLRIKRINNPFNWWFDPNASTITKSDGDFVIGLESVSLDELKKEYPKKDFSSFDTAYEGESQETWCDDDKVVVAEYYERQPVKKEIALLSSGVTVELDELTDEDTATLAANGVEIIKQRTADSYEIHYYKLTGSEVLEHESLPYRYFPVVPVFGEVDCIEGEDHVRGLIRPAKDPQRLYNYWNSAAAETIALQPKAPYIVTAKQVIKHKRHWDEANNKNLPYLPYDVDPTAPPPSRQAPPTLQSGFLQQAQIAIGDIQSAMGVHEGTVGAQSNEVSGVAIATRNMNAELTNSVYMFNLQQSIEHTGRVLIDMIPHYYDTHRTLKIVGEDGAQTEAVINQMVMTPDGLSIINDLTRGKYDVKTSVGPSYKTRRIEGAQTLLEMVRVFPQLQQIAGDLLVKSLDIPGAEELEARFKKILPPGLIEEEDPEKAQQMQAQAQQQAAIQQQQLQLQMATALAGVEEKRAQAEENRAGATLDLAKAQTEQMNNQQHSSEQLAMALQAVLSQMSTPQQSDLIFDPQTGALSDARA